MSEDTITTSAPAGLTITEEVSSWDGVETGYGKRGEFAFKFGRREIGHLHAAHFFFPAECCSRYESRKGGPVSLRTACTSRPKAISERPVAIQRAS